MSCSDCQKRMHLSVETNNNAQASCEVTPHVTSDPPIIDFSLPITTTYLNHMREKGYSKDDVIFNNYEQDQKREESAEDEQEVRNSLLVLVLAKKYIRRE